MERSDRDQTCAGARISGLGPFLRARVPGADQRSEARGFAAIPLGFACQRGPGCAHSLADIYRAGRLSTWSKTPVAEPGGQEGGDHVAVTAPLSNMGGGPPRMEVAGI